MSADRGRPSRAVYVGFANAKLPDSDYRVSFARDSQTSEVYLALPERPGALPTDRYFHLPIGEGFGFSTVLALLRVPVILRRSGADTAHFFATQLSLLGPLLARLSGVRSIITITGLGRTFDRGGAAGWVLRNLYVGLFRVAATCAESVLFQNEDDMRDLAVHASARTRHKFELVGSAIDGRLFSGLRHEPPGRPLCVMVARLHPSKGVADFLELARNLQGQAEFVLVGPPSGGATDLEARVRRAAADGIIRYEGPQQDWEVRELLTRATVLVIASRGEGIPRVVLEASLSGVAAIGYDIAGCRATLPRAALAQSFDAAELERLVSRALNDVPFRTRLVQDARTLAARDFSAESYAKRLDAVISKALMPRRDV